MDNVVPLFGRSVRVVGSASAGEFTVHVHPAADGFEPRTFRDPTEAGLYAHRLSAAHGWRIDWTRFRVGYLVPSFIEDAWEREQQNRSPDGAA